MHYFDTNPDTPTPPRAFRLIVENPDGSATEHTLFGAPCERETQRFINNAGSNARWTPDNAVCRVRAW